MMSLAAGKQLAGNHGRVSSPGAPVDLDRALKRLESRADAVFLREPAVDPSCPETSDLDLLVFGPVEELLPERFFFDGSRPVDLIWLPSASLDDAAAFARQGVLPHRLLSSRVVRDETGTFERKAREVEQAMFDPAVQSARIAGFLDLGFLTVREIGINWDFPGVALFYLHMAYAACLAALADASRVYSPNLYTRPLDYAPRLEAETGLDLMETPVAALRLDAEIEPLAEALQRVRRVLEDRFPEPAWPDAMRLSTRYEYRYFLAPGEVAWRIEAAREMARRGNAPNGVFYLRLLAYSLARVPSVHRHALAGEDASFLRPRHALGRELRALCPEIADDLGLALGNGATVSEVTHALEAVKRLESETVAFVEARGLPLVGLRDWVPHQENTEAPKRKEQHVQDRRDLRGL